MRGIGRLGTQDHFGVRGELDLAHAAAFVGDRQVPHLRIVLGRYENLHDRADGSVFAAYFRAVFAEGSLVDFRFPPDGLESRRPDVPIEYIPQNYVVTPRIPARLLPPA